MSACKPVIRPATRGDIDRFSDMQNKPSTRAYLAECDGEIIAMWGLALIGGRWFVFCDLTPDARRHKRTMVRTAKALFADAAARGIRFVYAQADVNEPGSVRWLTSLGLEIDPKSQSLYRWSAKRWQP